VSMFKDTISTASLLTALLLAGCGGGSDPVTSTTAQQSGQGVAVGEPNGGVPVASEFIKMAQGEACSDVRNRLFLIDSKQVYWEREGNCPDNAYTRRLFGPTPQAVLCETTDSLAGPRTFCANDTVRKLFETIEQNRAQPDLGLGAGHKVEQWTFLPKSGTAIEFRTLVKTSFSGVDKSKNVVVKGRAALETLWSEHFSKNSQPQPLPLVDFSRQMVLGVFTGDEVGGCAGMSVARVLSKDGKMVVEYQIHTAPLDAVCAAVVTQPSQIIVLERSDAPVEFVKLKVASLLAVSLDRTTRSQVGTARDVVVKDQQSWDALWAGHAGKDAKPPVVDFSKQMVAAVFLGQRESGCHTTTIDSVTRDDKQVTVRHVDTVPGPATLCTKDLTTPAHLVAIERSELPVVFAKEVKQL
jgi:hypothetical protein